MSFALMELIHENIIVHPWHKDEIAMILFDVEKCMSSCLLEIFQKDLDEVYV